MPASRRSLVRFSGTRSSCVSALIDTLEPRQLLAAATSQVKLGTVSPSTALPSSLVAISKDLYAPKTDIRFKKAGEVGRAYTQYQVRGSVNPNDVKDPLALTYKTPAQMRAAYDVNNIVFGSIVGDGAGQTIAIVDAYDDPSFVSSTASNYGSSDLVRFDTQYGIANPPSFMKVNQTGGTSYPSYDSGWAGEIALDVEWTHVMAPKANIVLVEANDSYDTSLLAAVNYAKTISGVSAVSMSYGGSESSNDISENSVYVTPAGHYGVTFVASTGDTGAPGGNPAFSPNVLAVGGTSLTTSGSAGTYSSEAGWSGSGGGISTIQGRPSYQTLITTGSTTKRTIPDVSIDADPNSGAIVLDTSAHGIGSGATYYVVGGTSLSSPMWAGLIAIANQGRASEGLDPLNGLDGPEVVKGQETLKRIYSLSTADYHDVTTGNNGYAASAGYDLVTGRGTPRSALLLPHLAGGTLSGSVFIDADSDGIQDSGEAGFAGASLYADLNNNSVQDAGESAVTTSASGAYKFDLAGGVSYTVRLTAASAGDYLVTTGAVGASAVNYGVNAGPSFGLTPSSFTGSALAIRLSANGTADEIFTNSDASGTPAYTIARSLLGSSTITLKGTSGADTFLIDLTNGSPLGSGGITITTTTAADTLSVLGSVNADSITLNNGSMTIGGAPVTFTRVGTINLTLAGGDDSLNVISLLSATTLNVDVGDGVDSLRVVTTVNSGFTHTTGSDATSGTYTFTNGTKINFAGVEREAPAAVTAFSDFTGIVPVLVVQFTNDVSGSIAGGAFTLNNLTDGTVVSPSAVTYDAATNTAQFSLVGIADGNFHGVISNTAITNPSGDALVSSVPLDFFVLNGDVNHDRFVSFSDLLLLAQNFGRSGQTYAQGNVNGSSDGLVNFSDLLILAQEFGKTLYSPAGIVAAAIFAPRPIVPPAGKKNDGDPTMLSELA